MLLGFEKNSRIDNFSKVRLAASNQSDIRFQGYSIYDNFSNLMEILMDDNNIM